MTRNKYKAKRTTVDNITFDSMKEAERYEQLKLLESNGIIHNLELQPAFAIVIDGEPVKIRSKGFPNGRSVKYIADFQYILHRDNSVVVEDVKGMDTPLSRLKRALVESIYGVRVRVV